MFLPRGGFPVDLEGRSRGDVLMHSAVLCRVEGEEAVAAVVEAEGDELLREVARAHVVLRRVLRAVADPQHALAQPGNERQDNTKRQN